jgi:GTP-sensing pleiotropic transcriptional regulator CodY
MKIAIVLKSKLNNCMSPLQYTDNCHQCDNIFSCKVKSKFHVKGLNVLEEIEVKRIHKETECRLKKLKNNVEQTLKKISN